MSKYQYPGLLLHGQSGITIIVTAYTEPQITQLYLYIDLIDLTFYIKIL